MGERCGLADKDLFFKETRKERKSSFVNGASVLFMVTLLFIFLGIIGFFCWR